MIAVPQVAEFVDHRILQHRLGGENQTPIEVDGPVLPATPPEVLLLLDPNLLGLEAVRSIMLTNKDRHIVPQPFSEPKPQRQFNKDISVHIRQGSGTSNDEAVTICDLDLGKRQYFQSHEN